MIIEKQTYVGTVTKKTATDSEDGEQALLSLEEGDVAAFISQSSDAMRKNLVQAYSNLNRRGVVHRIQRLQLAAGKQVVHGRT